MPAANWSNRVAKNNQIINYFADREQTEKIIRDIENLVFAKLPLLQKLFKMPKTPYLQRRIQ